MIQIKDKSFCSGCNACAEICPKHCIELVTDSKGFLYPKINSSVCIECGACERVCPFQKGNVALHAPIKAFAAWNKDKEKHVSSSSGGAAYVLSEYIVRSGGVVYGCTSDSMRIRHIRVDSLSDLSKLQGSKHVQSDVRGLFGRVKADLKADIPVLFIGTPCQVAGLKNYIKRIPEHLYLVDLICHGVPSQQMLHEHIECITKRKKVNTISFRKGNRFTLTLSGDNFDYTKTDYWHDWYLRGFMESITYRESCYQCVFAQGERAGDITIGDFWGLQNSEELPVNPQNGISVLLPCSEKGLRLIEEVSHQFAIYERDINEAIAGNPQLRRPTKQSVRQHVFNCIYPLFPFDIAVMTVVADEKLKSLFKLCIQFIMNGLRK